MPENTIIIIANSGRMLAQMAKNSGYDVVVIDCFSDTDTQILSLECIKVDSLALDSIKPAVCHLASQYKRSFAIVGSGFERYFSSLKYLHQKLKVLGNTPSVFSAVQNKPDFFSTLKQLKIPYPESYFQVPELKNGWLVKPMQGEGGLGIKKFKSLSETHANCYWQRFISGIPLSVLFIANGSGFKICGFHQQNIASISDNEFVFSGVISQPELDEEIKIQLNHWVSSLVKEFGLIGLNSIDFILDSDQCYVLEINPRPSASMQLYDSNLVTGHINSCLYQSLDIDINIETYSAYQIVFAETKVVIKKEIKWPKWVVDRPQAESIINTGMPICSIIARSRSKRQGLDQMLLKQQIVKKLIQIR